LRIDEIHSTYLDQYTVGAHLCRKTYKQGGVAIYEGWNFNSGNYLFTTDTK